MFVNLNRGPQRESTVMADRAPITDNHFPFLFHEENLDPVLRVNTH